MSDLAARLVHDASRAIMNAKWANRRTARAAVVAVLETLASHPFDLKPDGAGPFVTHEDVATQLRTLAERVKEAGNG